MLGEDETEEKFKRFYPDDLENLVYFVRNMKKAAKVPGNGLGSTSTGVTPKSTSFSSFAIKGSSFGQKK